MECPVQRIPGRAMAVNSFLVHGPDRVVAVDGMLTVSDAELVRAAVDRSEAPLAGVLVTHPHPDHYAGLAHIAGPDDVPIVATRAVDAVWWLDPGTVFAGDLAYNGMHAYLADGRWEEWLASLETFEARLDHDVTLHVGHGASGTKSLLAGQRRYIEAFVAALDTNVDAIAAGDHDPVLAVMKEVVPTDDLLFLLDLSIDPVHSARHAGGAVGRP